MPEGLPRGYAYGGIAALEQLIRLSASLDSLNPGEDQVLAQVRGSYELAKEAGTTGPLTDFALQNALRAAKRVRREVVLAPVRTSLFSLARPSFEAMLPKRARIALLGAGQMGELVARSMRARPETEFWIINRGLEKAQRLARLVGGHSLGLQTFLEGGPRVDGLVTVISAERLVGGAFFERQPDLRVVVDLGMPRNVDPVAAQQAGVRLIGSEELRKLGEVRRSRLEHALRQAEVLVQEITAETEVEWNERRLAPYYSGLRLAYQAKLAESLTGVLSEDELSRLANRVAHISLSGVRGLARRQGVEAAMVFLDEAGLLTGEGRA